MLELHTQGKGYLSEGWSLFSKGERVEEPAFIYLGNNAWVFGGLELLGAG